MGGQTGGQQQFGPQQAGSPELELQGIFGRLIGGALGGMIGKHFGGGTGQTIGNVAGGIAGSFLPLQAGPTAGGGQQSGVEAPTDLELQSFMSVFRKVTQTVKTGIGIGHNLGLFQAGPGGAEPISDLEMQGFGSFLRKVGHIAGKVLDTGTQVVNAGHNLGLFQAGPAAQGAEPISDLEMQAFWKVAARCAHGYGPGTGINPKASVAMFQAGPGGADVGDLEMQGFWDVVAKIGRTAARVVDTGKKVLDAGHQLGVFQAQPNGQQGVQQGAQQGGTDGIAQALATVQQAMPAIQQLAAMLQQQQQQAPAGTRLN